MNATIELILELVGGIILLLVAGYALALISGYNEYYDKMLYDDTDQTIKRKKKVNKNINNIMHHASI